MLPRGAVLCCAGCADVLPSGLGFGRMSSSMRMDTRRTQAGGCLLLLPEVQVPLSLPSNAWATKACMRTQMDLGVPTNRRAVPATTTALFVLVPPAPQLCFVLLACVPGFQADCDGHDSFITRSSCPSIPVLVSRRTVTATTTGLLCVLHAP